MSELNTEEYTKHRRTTDAQQEKIDALIAEESDSKVRLTLTVMANINRAISANTGLTQELHREVKVLKTNFELHMESMAAAKNQGMGAYKVMRIAAPLLWVIMGGAVGAIYHDYGKFRKEFYVNVHDTDVKIKGIEIKQGILMDLNKLSVPVETPLPNDTKNTK